MLAIVAQLNVAFAQLRVANADITAFICIRYIVLMGTNIGITLANLYQHRPILEDAKQFLIQSRII